MALIVAPTAGAESYISVADADTYHAARGNAAWAALPTEQKEQALRKACDYMESVYGASWAGYRLVADQPLSWPRSMAPRVGVYGTQYWPSSPIPAQIGKANAELGLRASTGELAADQSRATKREKVGPIEVEYSDYASQAVRYVAVDALLGQFLAGGAGAFRKVVRT